MSEQIKITVVMNDENSNIKNSGKSIRLMTLTQESALTLMPGLLKNGLMDGSFCGGRGDCGRCVVQFLEGAPLPTGLERNRLEPEELRQGYRLACVTRPKADCTIKIVGAEETETPIVTEVNLPPENIDLSGQKSNLSENQKLFVTQSEMQAKTRLENGLSCYIIAVDLGTTTIAMQMRESVTGTVTDTYCEINPQRRYGSDVLARIRASVEGHGEELRRLVCEVLLRGLSQFAENLREKTDEPCTGNENVEGAGAAAESVSRKESMGKFLGMCIAGNTVMEHLLLGMDVSSLGKAPFVPVEKGLQKITFARFFEGWGSMPENLCMTEGGISFDFPIYIAPCISAFVGGDIVAGLYALGLLAAEAAGDREKPGKADGESGADESLPETAVKRRAVLLIDLGTNGEMAITDGRRMIVTATAAGPAFEGDGTMMGTDRIALTARLLRRGILDETGLLEEPYFTEGVQIEGKKEAPAAGAPKKNGCYFKQKNIRALQMAKAAIRAGVEILWEEMGCPEIEKVFLAGGFGYYLDVEAAVAIGLLPASMRGRVQAAGNTSLAGAYELGRDLCGKQVDAAWLEERTAFAESMNLAETERFEGLYLKYMNLGEN